MIAEPEQDSSVSGPNAPQPYPEAGTASPAGGMAPIWKWILALAIIALLAYPVIRRLRTPVDNPDSAEAQLNRSLELYQAGKFADSITAAQAALKARPGYALAYNNLAVANLQLKKYDDALQNAQEALRLQPDLELAKNNLAMIQQEKARASAPPPEPLKPGTADFYLQQSLESFQGGEFQKSIDTAQQALKLDPASAKAYNNISVSYTRLGLWDKAIDNALKALQIQPDFELARNNLNWALTSRAEALAKKK